MRAAIIKNGVVDNVVVVDDADDPGKYGAQECPDYVGPRWKYAEGKYTPPESAVQEPEPELPVTFVTATQAKIQLHRAGMLVQTENVIAQSGDVELQLWYAGAQTWRIDNSHVQQIGGAFGLTPEQIQEMFEAASQIDA